MASSTPTQEFTLPSGRTVELRELTGNEEEILADERQMRDGTALDRVMRNCIVRLDDNEDVKESDVRKMLSGDRIAALVHIRQITFGDDLDMTLTCPNPKCGHKNAVHASLADAEETRYPAEREFTFALPGCGQTVVFGLSTGEHETRLVKLKDDANLHSMMLMRIVTVDGKPPARDTIRDWSSRDLSALRAQMRAVDGGIDTKIEAVCSECGAAITTMAHVEPSFFFPQATPETS